MYMVKGNESDAFMLIYQLVLPKSYGIAVGQWINQ